MPDMYTKHEIKAIKHTSNTHIAYYTRRACDYVYIDYVRRSRSSSCRLVRPINCQTYITLHYKLIGIRVGIVQVNNGW